MNATCSITPLPQVDAQDDQEYFVEVTAGTQSMKLALNTRAIWELYYELEQIDGRAIPSDWTYSQGRLVYNPGRQVVAINHPQATRITKAIRSELSPSLRCG